MFGAAIAGTMSDRLGRKKVLLVSAVLFTVSAIGSAVPRDLSEFVIARILGGIGVGMASVMSPLYIAEVSPAQVRGRLVSLNQFAIVFGMLVVYFVNALVAQMGDEAWNIASGWRWMFGSETLPALLFMVLLIGVPESPRWLTKQGKEDQALVTLTRIGGLDHARSEMAEIKDAIALETGSISELFLPSMRIPLMIGIVLAVLQQVTGINVVMYYAPVIFKSTGLASTDAINDTVLVGVVMMAFTLVAVWVVDRVGRKALLLFASAGMGIALTLLGGAFIFEKFEGRWVLMIVLGYVASFAVGMGPVVWVIISELFPTCIRGRAMSIATVCLWIACYAVSQLFPLMLEQLAGYAFFIYAAMCALAFVFVACCVPETAGKSLEEIEKGWLQGVASEVEHG